MNQEYVWSAFGAVAGLSAQTAGEELERIRQRSNGVLTAEGVVQASRAKRAVLHPAFEWDDAKAAKEHRTQQARHLINHVQVKVTNGEELPPVRAFVNIAPDPDQDGYSASRDVVADPEMARRFMERGLNELKSVQRRYGEWKEFAGVVGQAIEAVEEKLELAA